VECMKDEFLKQIKPLAKQLQRLQEQAERLGVFIGDRELLECDECGLEEDVTADGFLIVYRKPVSGTDTGLRFTEDVENKGKYLCPVCGKPAQFSIS